MKLHFCSPTQMIRLFKLNQMIPIMTMISKKLALTWGHFFHVRQRAPVGPTMRTVPLIRWVMCFILGFEPFFLFETFFNAVEMNTVDTNTINLVSSTCSLAPEMTQIAPFSWFFRYSSFSRLFWRLKLIRIPCKAVSFLHYAGLV